MQKDSFTDIPKQNPLSIIYTAWAVYLYDLTHDAFYEVV